ncbi:hypothetical protein C8A00DRAFT_13664 [Chaetomidium leptoderma]|uniref:C2H2-type domain-containing protein n=1 Tax=Chaetomidium leptoderma TaxID=669021 RepID=A0AAN6VP88_9PEZI|nr:hypothetical protein C8A00DRAFT_13664 [Chaetomidium leptoderma]
MGLITSLRGFKVPIAVLDRFLVSNGVEETWGSPPSLFRIPGSNASPLDPQSAFLRSRLAAESQVRIFIPYRRGEPESAYAYVAYAFVMVFGQRHIDLAAELPDQAPPGFVELRREVLGYAQEGEEASLQAAGMQGEDAASSFFILLTETREMPLERPWVRESDVRCDHCAAFFENWSALQEHRGEAHGVVVGKSLPDDL